jgi:tetratricopeptide (TPR) repeat protein
MAQARLGKVEAAFESFRLCQTRFLDENTYLIYAELAANVGKTSEARETIALLLATQPSENVTRRARYVQAVIAIRAGDLAQASAELRSLVEDASDFEAARIALASVLAAQGSKEDAIREYNQALTLIDKKLAAAEKKTSSGTRMTAAEYGELRSSVATLRSERSTIVERLKALGGS